MILSGPEIRKQVLEGKITVTPFDEKYINPASLDLHLGNKVAVYDDITSPTPQGARTFDGSTLQRLDRLLDSKKELRTREYTIDPELGWVLNPGVGYLMHTAEMVGTSFFVPILDGKSSIGRLFVKIHETAGFGDPGFYGHYTLEVTSMFPIRVYPGMRFCQIRFHAIQGEVQKYDGNYTHERATGPVGSRAWKSAFT